MSDSGAILKRSCDLILADPALRPEYDANGKLLVTHCNQGVRLVAQAIGCHEFDDPNATADIMLGIVKENKSGLWSKIPDGISASIRALSGDLVIAGLTSAELGEAHGHICIVYPIGSQRSASLGRDVPSVANIGPGDPAAPLVDSGRNGIRTRNNWLCSVSWAFPCKRLEKEPNYFLWG